MYRHNNAEQNVNARTVSFYCYAECRYSDCRYTECRGTSIFFPTKSLEKHSINEHIRSPLLIGYSQSFYHLKRQGWTYKVSYEFWTKFMILFSLQRPRYKLFENVKKS